jgi:hypothetical protein
MENKLRRGLFLCSPPRQSRGDEAVVLGMEIIHALEFRVNTIVADRVFRVRKSSEGQFDHE